jgi:hypothetical protein
MEFHYSNERYRDLVQNPEERARLLELFKQFMTSNQALFMVEASAYNPSIDALIQAFLRAMRYSLHGQEFAVLAGMKDDLFNLVQNLEIRATIAGFAIRG